MRRYGGGRSPPIDQTWRRIRAYDSAMEATREAPPPSLSLEHYILHEYARAGGTGDVADRRRFAHLLVLLKTFLDALEDSAGSAGAS